MCVLDILSLRVKTGISHWRLRPTLAGVDPLLTMADDAAAVVAGGGHDEHALGVRLGDRLRAGVGHRVDPVADLRLTREIGLEDHPERRILPGDEVEVVLDRGEHLGPRRLRRSVQRLPYETLQRGAVLVEQGEVEVELGGEVAVDAPRGDAGAARDGGHRGGGVAALGELVERGGDDPLARGGRTGAGPIGRSVGHLTKK